MKLWLVCFLILFFGAETVQWLGHLPWLSSGLSLPLVVLGGAGLAIASNYRYWLSASISNQPDYPLPTAPSPGTGAASAPPPKTSRKGDTISFEIKKPRGEQADG
ncbi:MAG: hypothetical protein WBG38_14360 [Nodosilinea sp.]